MSRQPTSVVREADSVVQRMSLLKHPFYRLWSEGGLTLDDLRGYSREYYHLVTSVPRLVENVRARATLATDRETIAESVREEESHIGLWEKFACGIGAKTAELHSQDYSRATRKAVTRLAELTSLSFEEGAAALYAYESELPSISRSKIDGLERYYGVTAPETLRYFVVHETVDVKHAAIWRSIMNRSRRAQRKDLVQAASASMGALNDLLTSIQAKYVN